MPLYSVRLFGTGVSYEDSRLKVRCISFHTAIATAGARPEDAVARARHKILKEWSSEIGIVQWLGLLVRRSYVFYPDNPFPREVHARHVQADS